MFNDLIPNKGIVPQAKTGVNPPAGASANVNPAGSGMFSDLIPSSKADSFIDNTYPTAGNPKIPGSQYANKVINPVAKFGAGIVGSVLAPSETLSKTVISPLEDLSDKYLRPKLEFLNPSIKKARDAGMTDEQIYGNGGKGLSINQSSPSGIFTGKETAPANSKEQFAGALGQTALNVVGGPELKIAGTGAKGLLMLGARGLGIGAGYGATDAMYNNKSAYDTTLEAIKTAPLGAAVELGLGGGSKLLKSDIPENVVKYGPVGAYKEASAAKTVLDRTNDLDTLSNNYTTLKKVADKAKQNGHDVHADIAKTDLLQGSVDHNGSIDTREGIAKLNDFIKPQEDVISKNLEREGKSIPISDVATKLKNDVDNSGIEGASKIKAYRQIQDELAGYNLSNNADGYIPLKLLHDAKVDKYSTINYLNPESAKLDKVIAKSLKELVQDNTKSVDVQNINKELGRYYSMQSYLEKLRGKKVEGGRLGKHFAKVIGGAVGSHFGPLGTVVGSEIAGAIKGRAFTRKFGTGGEALKYSENMENAIRTGNSPKLALPPRDPNYINKIPSSGKVIQLPDEKGLPEFRKRKFENIGPDQSNLVNSSSRQNAQTIKTNAIRNSIEDSLATMKPKVNTVREENLVEKRRISDQKAEDSYYSKLAKTLPKDGEENNYIHVPTEIKHQKLDELKALKDHLDYQDFLHSHDKTQYEDMLDTVRNMDKSGMVNHKSLVKMMESGVTDIGSTKNLIDYNKYGQLVKKTGTKANTIRGLELNGGSSVDGMTSEEVGQKMYDKLLALRDLKDSMDAHGIQKVRSELTATNKEIARIEKSLAKGENTPGKMGGFVEVGSGKQYDSTKFTNFKDISTKILSKLEGRDTVGKQFISDLTNSGDVKQVEKDMIRSLLHEEGDKVNVKDFANKVKAELLPLTRDGVGTEFEHISLPKDLRGKVKNYSENVYQSPIKTSAGKVHFGDRVTDKSGDVNNYFGHTRIEDMADNQTRRVIEVQSDLYQKGGLERESRIIDKNTLPNTDNKVTDTGFESASKAKQDLQKLQQYNNPTAHFRMIREEIKKAAQDGKEKLQFPTGETAMKIEGLGATANWHDLTERTGILKPETLKIGKEISGNPNARDDHRWIITDVLGDGKFKAVQKSQITQSEIDTLLMGDSDRIREHLKEQFDISGKVDTSNPIYKFYNKDLANYVKNNYGAKEITDNKGVSWYEMEVKPEMADKPVNAFSMGGFLPAGAAVTGGITAAVKGAQAMFGSKKTVDATPDQKKRDSDSIDKNSGNGYVDKNKIGEILHNIESSGGKDTLGYVARRKTQFPPDRKMKDFNYTVGYAKEYGFTPIAISQMIMDGELPNNESQLNKLLKNRKDVEKVAVKYFMKGFDVADPKVNDILNHYRDKYMTKASPFYNDPKVTVHIAEKIRKFVNQ